MVPLFLLALRFHNIDYIFYQVEKVSTIRKIRGYIIALAMLFLSPYLFFYFFPSDLSMKTVLVLFISVTIACIIITFLTKRLVRKNIEKKIENALVFEGRFTIRKVKKYYITPIFILLLVFLGYALIYHFFVNNEIDDVYGVLMLNIALTVIICILDYAYPKPQDISIKELTPLDSKAIYQNELEL